MKTVIIILSLMLIVGSTAGYRVLFQKYRDECDNLVKAAYMRGQIDYALGKIKYIQIPGEGQDGITAWVHVDSIN